MINIMNYMRPLGFIAILIAVFTWGLDLTNLVPPCVYCRSQRTIIGLLGILMMLPHYRYISIFLTVVFGLFGTHVSCAHIFMQIRGGDYFHPFTLLAICALFIMVGQVLMLITRTLNKQ